MTSPPPTSSSSRPSLSVVIPALNEADIIAGTLQSVREAGTVHEILVVDGGSSDATREAAAPYATVLSAPRGRARQMNAGADHATGDALLFLHADTRLSAHALRLAHRAVAAGASGTFRLRFDHPTPLLRAYAACTRVPWIRLCFGDRGLACPRHRFDAVGGFPDWPIFEDLELAYRLHRSGPFRFLDAAVTTSARRFRRNGPVRQQLLNARLWAAYLAGAAPERLARDYRYDTPSTGAA